MSHRMIVWWRPGERGLRRTLSFPVPVLLLAARRAIEAGAARVRIEAADGSMVFDIQPAAGEAVA